MVTGAVTTAPAVGHSRLRRGGDARRRSDHAGAGQHPVGWAIAGGAVLAYGAWSLGNYVYDHWDDISEFAGNAVDWTGDRISDVGEGLETARDWAGDQLTSAGESLGDAADTVGGVISSGLDALPDISIF